ncbi:S-adenosyl-L-methionine-dependent methyltransferase [Heliocybe sulcata]|uniref:S-adenosyl-L-methionine-dependent methyltransferase n=1 Tax=Heliocybe sulcata TaxID=5364 RepID=A0A5C3N778_9AGAM|nr:S-adenosyl-L-methionine-dependent methyltransferase [Heliocybe sulcata]
MSTTSEISCLLETLTSSIDAFRAELTNQQLPEPSLCTSKPHPIDDPSYVPSPRMYEARRLAVSSLNQLKLLLESPVDAALGISMRSAEIQSVRLAAEIHLPEVLDTASDTEEGEHIEAIAEKTETDERKLEGIVRFLVKTGWFRETKAGYFANNRRSHTLRTGQPGYLVFRNFNDYCYNVHGKLTEAMTHPDKSFRMARDLTRTAWNLHIGKDMPFFGPNGWTEKYPEEAQKFALGMGAMGAASDRGVIQDFLWADVAKDKDAVIDVGGGQGTLSCSLAAAYPEIKSFVVQDLPAVRQPAESYIASKGLSDRVKFEEQDFFQANRRKGTGNYVFILQKVLHDWSEEDGAEILRRIAECLADSKSTLLIIDPLLSPATFSAEGPSARDSLATLEGANHYQPAPPPPFIPQDAGDNWLIPHTVSICLIAIYNASEHTHSSMAGMLEAAGMQIKKVTATRGYVQVTEVELLG